MAMDKDTSERLAAQRPIRKPNLYGAPITRSYGAVTHRDEFGTDLALRSKTPPPIAEYDEWLRRPQNRIRRHSASDMHAISATGFRLRRIVIMRRNGSTWKECGEAVGVTGNAASHWVMFLPPELAV